MIKEHAQVHSPAHHRHPYPTYRSPNQWSSPKHQPQVFSFHGLHFKKTDSSIRSSALNFYPQIPTKRKQFIHSSLFKFYFEVIKLDMISKMSPKRTKQWDTSTPIKLQTVFRVCLLQKQAAKRDEAQSQHQSKGCIKKRKSNYMLQLRKLKTTIKETFNKDKKTTFQIGTSWLWCQPAYFKK